jgi:hypothetical protein
MRGGAEIEKRSFASLRMTSKSDGCVMRRKYNSVRSAQDGVDFDPLLGFLYNRRIHCA